MVGHFTDSEVVLEFLASEKLPELAELGTSCPDHFLRTKVKPLVLDVPTSASVDECVSRLAVLHEQYRTDYAAYYERHATADSPAMRGADPAIVLVPGVGMFSYGKDKQTARVAGEFYVNAINVMRGAESLSSYAPIPESEKFRIEYWALEEAKLQRLPAPKRHAGRIALVTGAAGGIGKAIATRLAADGACIVIADLDADTAREAAAEIGNPDVAVGVQADVTDAAAVRAAVDATLLAFGGIDLVVNNAGLSISKPLLDTTEQDWDVQHDVMAKGSFLVAQAAARAMIAQGLGGDIVYIASKNALFAGPNNVAYSATKADQAHQVRLLAAELGEHGIRVNGVNPDGVVRGSGIFASGWGAERAAVYGVPEDELGAFYAQRTLLKLEVLPEHVANAVTAICSDEFSHTTGSARSGRRRRRRSLSALMPVFAAVDIGASGGRVMAGVVERDRVRLEAVHRFANGVAEVDGHLRWDFTTLYREVVAGLERVPEALSIGIDTWAIDYGLLDGDGNLLAEPIAYRDGRTAEVIDDVHAVVPPDELYAINGLQFLPFNTIYQLAAERDSAVWPDVAHAVLVPDLVAHGLTGELRTELTNASTTGLVDARSRQWSTELFSPARPSGVAAAPAATTWRGARADLGRRAGRRGRLARHGLGRRRGSRDDRALRLHRQRDVVARRSRARRRRSSPRPPAPPTSRTRSVSMDAPASSATSAGCGCSRSAMREWQRDDLEDLLAAAGQLAAGGPIIDVDDPAFIPPGRMPDRIAAAAGRPAMTEVETTRCILDSLAAGYAQTVERASTLAGRDVDVIHVVGGGSQNAVLCQLTADAAGVPVLAGPVEATALGNVLVQARAHGAVSASLEAMRSTIAASFALQRYEPR